MTPVLDLVRFRLQKEVTDQPDPYLAHAAQELVQLYDAGIVKADVERGELVLSLSDHALKALQTGGLYELLEAHIEEGSDDAEPLNTGPSG